jgi:hypothetical protein
MDTYFGNFTWPGLTVACPICKRAAGAICCDPRGNGRWGKPHQTRLKLEQSTIPAGAA